MFYISVFVVLSVLSCSTIHLIKTANSLTNGTKHTVSSSVPQPTGNCSIVKGCLSCLTSPLLVLISSAHGAASKLWLDGWLFFRLTGTSSSQKDSAPSLTELLIQCWQVFAALCRTTLTCNTPPHFVLCGLIYFFLFHFIYFILFNLTDNTLI